MPYLTLQIAPGGPVLDAWIGVSHARRTALQSASQPIPAPSQVRALIDTGASDTCIDPSVLKALGLSPIGQCLVNTPTTGNVAETRDQYDISLVILHPQKLAPFVRSAMPVICTELFATQGIHALIGRDILRECLRKFSSAPVVE